MNIVSFDKKNWRDWVSLVSCAVLIIFFVVLNIVINSRVLLVFSCISGVSSVFSMLLGNILLKYEKK